MKVLVTGLTGFTGHYVQGELKSSGYEVFGLKNNLIDKDSLAAEIKQLQPEAIIHLAAIAFVGQSNVNEFYQVNLIGTRNLLEVVEQYSPTVQSILLASSANVYGNRSEGILSETDEPNPANDYAVSKFAMEKMAALWLSRLPLFIVRPFNYTGVGQNDSFLIPKIVAHFQKRASVIELGNLDIWREFNDVRMIAEIYRKLLHLSPVGQTLNVCTGKSYSLREIIQFFETITGYSIEVKVNPKLIRDNEVRTLTGSNVKLKKLMGDFEVRKLEDTLKWMLNSKRGN